MTSLRVVDIEDDALILSLLARDPSWTAYALADLDDPYRQHAHFRGAMQGETLAALLLIYMPPGLVALLPFGSTEGVTAILRESADLPEAAFVLCLADHLPAVEQHYTTAMVEMLRMVLRASDFRPATAPAAPIERLTVDDIPRISTLFTTPSEGGFFDRSLVETGYYFGAVIGGKLVAMGGIHTVSPRFACGTIGNVYTHPDYRGRGLATAVTSAVVEALMSAGCNLIALNVRADNAPAIAAYRRLGFETYLHFLEGQARLREL